MIDPKVLKGFRDALPNEELARRNAMAHIENALRSFGYVPIDTPALEYREVLTGKGGDDTDKQLFLFQDNGGRDVGLRFDLTVPLARYVAANERQLIFPFKRYHIAKVWRGEKPQRGRYREFYQADFDFIGVDSLASDAEILNVVQSLLEKLNIEHFVIHVNDRALIHSIMEKVELLEFEKQILHTIDKIYKIGAENVKTQLVELMGEEKFSRIAFMVGFAGSSAEFFDIIRSKFAIDNCRLEQVVATFHARGLAHRIKVDPAITRGLDYYTGLVFETYLTDSMNLGSISSGGRYANLTALFSKTVYSGIGGSIGLDRLLAYLAEKNDAQTQSHVDVMVVNFSDADLATYLSTAAELRTGGFSVEVYPDTAKLKKQFAYADAKKVRFALMMGEDEIKAGRFKVKNLSERTEQEYTNLQTFLQAAGNPQ